MFRNFEHVTLICLLSLTLVLSPGCTPRRPGKDIRGINEQLYELEKNRTKDSERLKKLEEKVNVHAPKPDETVNKTEAETEDSDNLYKEGYKKYMEQNYPEAIRILSRLTVDFKDDAFLGNALYWQAESYAKINQPDQALNYYQMVYRYFPFSSKADSALYKIGLSYFLSKDYNRALLAFHRFILEYPDSDLYKTVSLKIKELNDKHRNKNKSRSKK